jgi:small-conductance mechanosensitive channel
MPDEPSLELPSLFRRKRRAPSVEEGRSPVARPRGPRVPPLAAAILTGALVGLAAAGLVWLALRGCSGLRGTSSCGDPGILVLLAILVVMVLAGRFALAALRVPDAGSTAFLGLALLAVLALLFVDDLDSAVGAVVLALVGASTFGLAQWLTANFTEPGERPR